MGVMAELKESRLKYQSKATALETVLKECATKSGDDNRQDYDLSKTDKLGDGTTSERLAKLRGMREEVEALGTEIDEMSEIERAQKSSDGYKAPPVPEGNAAPRQRQKGIGELFVESAAYKNRGQKMGADIDVEMKTLFQTSAGWEPESMRSGTLILDAQRPPQVMDLIPQTTTQQASVVYMEETTFTNNAVEKSEGGSFGEAAFALTERTVAVRKIPIFLPITDEQLEDEAQASSYVESRLRFMIEQRLDLQVIMGDGIAPNIAGILYNAGTQQVYEAASSDSRQDAIHRAITASRVTGRARPNAVVMHPNDWETLRLAREGTTGAYLWGPPSTSGPMQVWGLPVVLFDGWDEGTSIVGDFANFASLAMRRGIEVRITDSHSTYFVEGKQAIRADLRAALVNYRPAAFVRVDDET